MLDLAVIIPELRKRGGAERFLIECLVRWQHLHDITVYATAFNEELFAEVGLTRITTKLLTPRFEGPHSTLLNATLLPKIWESEVGRHDLYHTHLWPTHLLNLHPMVWYPHEPLRLLYDLRYSQVEDDAVDAMQKKLHFYPKETYDNVNGRQYEAILRTIEDFDQTGRPDRVVGNSLYTAKYLEQVYGRSVTDYVYPGVTVEDMLDLPGSRNIVLTIGQLWPHKRIRLIIEAISQVEELQLYIIGSGPEKRRLEKIAENMGVADRVFFLHGLDNHEVQILLARCLCVVFTPVREPFGIVALEALASGKPLIAVNEGGYAEVTDDDCAMLVPPLPNAIADKIRLLQGDPELAGRMGRHGREVAARHSWDRTAKELLAILEETHRQWHNKYPTPGRKSGPLFAIHYYLWYREGFGNAHWCDRAESGWVTDAPEIGYYASINGDTITAHLDLLEEIGMDVVVLNLHINDSGLDVYQIHAAQRMQEIAAKRGSQLRFVVNFCFFTREPACIDSAVRMVQDGVMSRANYLALDSRPVVMIFWTGAFDGDFACIDHLRHLTADTCRIGVYMRPINAATEKRKTLGLFHSYSQISPLELSQPENWETVWQNEYKNSVGTGGYRSVTVCPGYDDSHLTDPARIAGMRTIPHRDGETYRRTMDFALQQSDPTFVFVTSFNEYHENTHIEPSLNFGRKYLDMTAAFVAEARKRWGNTARRKKGQRDSEGTET